MDVRKQLPRHCNSSKGRLPPSDLRPTTAASSQSPPPTPPNSSNLPAPVAAAASSPGRPARGRRTRRRFAPAPQAPPPRAPQVPPPRGPRRMFGITMELRGAGGRGSSPGQPGRPTLDPGGCGQSGRDGVQPCAWPALSPGHVLQGLHGEDSTPWQPRRARPLVHLPFPPPGIALSLQTRPLPSTCLCPPPQFRRPPPPASSSLSHPWLSAPSSLAF